MADEDITAETGGDENELNVVRDILFGAKTREHERRFEELRHLWTSSLNEARREFRERLEALERDSRKQVHDILEKIELEHAAWQDRAIEMKQRLQDLYEDHENKLNELRTMEANLIRTHQESLSDWLKRLESTTKSEKEQ